MLEAHVQVLEDTVHQLRVQRAEDLVQLKDHARKESSEAIDYMQKSVDRELTPVVNLVFALDDPDRPGWRRWWLGPAMLAFGLVLGVVANILSALLAA